MKGRRNEGHRKKGRKSGGKEREEVGKKGKGDMEDKRKEGNEGRR